jgi:multicomponent Na+:H+ antiporter subunit D
MMANQWAAITVIVISTLLNAAYFLPIIYRAFFVAPRTAPDDHHHGEAPVPMLIAMCLTTLAVLMLFLFPDLPLALAKQMLER